MVDETFDGWDAEVTLIVTVKVTAQPNPDYFEGWLGRTPEDCAMSLLSRVGWEKLERMDGYADLIGEADIVDVSVELGGVRW